MTANQVCRACLAQDTRLHTINMPMQRFYETITQIPLNTKDGRPSSVCYVCYHLLKKCHRFTERAIKADEALQRIRKSGTQVADKHIATVDQKSLSTFHRTPVTYVTTNDALDNIQKNNVKYFSYDVKNENVQQVMADSITNNVYLELEVEKTFEIKKEKIDYDEMECPHDNRAEPDGQMPLHSVTIKSEIESFEENTQRSEGYPTDNIKREIGIPTEMLEVQLVVPRDDTSSSHKNVQTIPTNTGYTNAPNVALNPESYDEKLCNFCGKKFPYKSLLTRHLLIHSGEKPYKCSFCDKSFTMSNGLTQHVKRIHTCEKPHTCPYCGKKFLAVSILTKHLMVHTGDKPYPCVHCGKKYSDKLRLKNHIRMHTGERPFACNYCEKQFTENYLLKRHLRTHFGKKAKKNKVQVNQS